MIRALLAAGLFFTLSCGAGMSARIEGFRLTGIRPNQVSPAQSSFTVDYDLIVSSPVASPVPVPVDHFDMGIFLEGSRAATTQLPAGTRAIPLGKPIALSSQVTLSQVEGIATLLPQILFKTDWDVGIQGTVGLQTLRLPVDFKTTVQNPVRKGGSLIPTM